MGAVSGVCGGGPIDINVHSSLPTHATGLWISSYQNSSEQFGSML